MYSEAHDVENILDAPCKVRQSFGESRHFRNSSDLKPKGVIFRQGGGLFWRYFLPQESPDWDYSKHRA